MDGMPGLGDFDGSGHHLDTRESLHWSVEPQALAEAERGQLRECLLQALDALPDARHVMVRNAGRVKPGEDFQVIDGHPAWQAIVASGVRVVDMPMLQATMPTIDRLNATFTDALGGCVRDGAAQLGPFDRQRVKLWLAAMDAAWEGILP